MQKSYIQTYLERDLHQLIAVKDLDQFQRFLGLCAGRIGQLFVASQVASDVGVSANTIQSWLSILQASYIVYLLPPFFGNVRKRLIKSPKLYFYDVGLASHLLGIHTAEQAERDPLRGALFENMVVMDQLKAQINQGQEPRMFFYRDQQGIEIDLIVQSARHYVPIEIKAGHTFRPEFTKSLLYFQNLVKIQSKTPTLLYSGSESFTHNTVTVSNWRMYDPAT
jgi:predicted AAA+ superfamily ATPase